MDFYQGQSLGNNDPKQYYFKNLVNLPDLKGDGSKIFTDIVTKWLSKYVNLFSETTSISADDYKKLPSTIPFGFADPIDTIIRFFIDPHNINIWSEHSNINDILTSKLDYTIRIDEQSYFVMSFIVDLNYLNAAPVTSVLVNLYIRDMFLKINFKLSGDRDPTSLLEIHMYKLLCISSRESPEDAWNIVLRATSTVDPAYRWAIDFTHTFLEDDIKMVSNNAPTINPIVMGITRDYSETFGVASMKGIIDQIIPDVSLLAPSDVPKALYACQYNFMLSTMMVNHDIIFPDIPYSGMIKDAQKSAIFKDPGYTAWWPTVQGSVPLLPQLESMLYRLPNVELLTLEEYLLIPPAFENNSLKDVLDRIIKHFLNYKNLELLIKDKKGSFESVLTLTYALDAEEIDRSLSLQCTILGDYNYDDTIKKLTLYLSINWNTLIDEKVSGIDEFSIENLGIVFDKNDGSVYIGEVNKSIRKNIVVHESGIIPIFYTSSTISDITRLEETSKATQANAKEVLASINKVLLKDFKLENPEDVTEVIKDSYFRWLFSTFYYNGRFDLPTPEPEVEESEPNCIKIIKETARRIGIVPPTTINDVFVEDPKGHINAVNFESDASILISGLNSTVNQAVNLALFTPFNEFHMHHFDSGSDSENYKTLEFSDYKLRLLEIPLDTISQNFGGLLTSVISITFKSLDDSSKIKYVEFKEYANDDFLKYLNYSALGMSLDKKVNPDVINRFRITNFLSSDPRIYLITDYTEDKWNPFSASFMYRIKCGVIQHVIGKDATFKKYFTDDNDTSNVDTELLILGTIVYYKNMMGIDYTIDEQRYQTYLQALIKAQENRNSVTDTTLYPTGKE
jgi:hypothetical protein